MKISVPALILMILGAGMSHAADFYVSPEGSDSNSGSARKPFASIVKARDAARSVKGPNRIILAPGRYFNAEPLVLDDRDSGLTIRGKKSGAAAEIYGGVPVTGWEKWKGDIWRAPVPKGQRFFNLIVDGKPATMAQTPNPGGGFGGGAHRIDNETIAVPVDWRGYDYADAQVGCGLGSDWFSEMREVVAPPDTNGMLKVDAGSRQFGGLNGHFILRGVLEFLDEPGEWCLKSREGYLYYWPKNGTPPEHVIVRPAGEKLFDVHGRSFQALAKNITIENVSMLGSDFCLRWYLFPPDVPIKINSIPEPLRQGLVFGENVEGLKVSGCRIIGAGHSAVFLNGYAQNCVIENSLISQAGANGIMLNGWIAGEGPFGSAEESDVNKGHRIENNFIHDCGKLIPCAAAVEVFQSGNLLIARNEISMMARCGIMLRGVRWGELPKTLYGKALDTTSLDDYFRHVHTRNIRVIGNEIYNVCRCTDDFGAIECWGIGRDHLWENNEVHDIDHAMGWNSWGHALFVDDSSHWVTVRGNIVHHFHGGGMTGVFMLKNIEETVENNFVADCNVGRLVTFEPWVEPAWNMSIRHNIFAVDGAASRYGNVNGYSLKGKAFGGVQVPKDASGFREVNNNWINPRDPKNPNPVAQFKMDLDSTFQPAPYKRLKPDWDATAADYKIDPPRWFKPIDVRQIGLKKEFPFDTVAWTRRPATEKIQAEDYQRTHVVRALGGYGICNLLPGSWVKYANVDFGKGVSRAVLKLDAPNPAPNAAPVKSFVLRTGDSLVEAISFKGDGSTEVLQQWEFSKPYTRAGKSGLDLFDEVLAPETDPKAGEWTLCLKPFTSKSGMTPGPGVVDFYVANGEGSRDSCGYARAAIHAEKGRTDARMTVTAASGVKVWVNGQLIIAQNKGGKYSIENGVIKPGWNTVLVKVCQGISPSDFSFKFGMEAGSCGRIVTLPGLPDKVQVGGTTADTIIKLCLDSPEGQVIGELEKGQTECRVKNAAGVHNLYLVFPGGGINSVDWIRFQ